MNEMIERVARAICKAHWRLKGLSDAVADDEAGNAWDLWTEEARAAIAAMRVPTEVMIQAADECEDYATYYASAETILGAMIDAALAEPVTKT